MSLCGLTFAIYGHLLGESAPSERQVSPDKLYRAAFLRNRFVDTILKAQVLSFSIKPIPLPTYLLRFRANFTFHRLG